MRLITYSFLSVSFVVGVIFMLAACAIQEGTKDKTQSPEPAPSKKVEGKSDYYEKFYEEIVARHNMRKGSLDNVALDNLPKDAGGQVNWTAALLKGLINPRGTIDPNGTDDPPFDLNIFFEAKTPLMSNVIFPHSIHTYWFNCNNCHPQIFIPQAGANPVRMDEIFEGKWCGRCHGKVAFDFFPLSNCRRCHIVMKGQSREVEHWR
ncbi:MAG: hypothetical protein HY880_01070 [Deltaproteobacteria bacterium]|nr:hypothetical protein [Deltaproteobacteria bacterium]